MSNWKKLILRALSVYPLVPFRRLYVVSKYNTMTGNDGRRKGNERKFGCYKQLTRHNTSRVVASIHPSFLPTKQATYNTVSYK